MAPLALDCVRILWKFRRFNLQTKRWRFCFHVSQRPPLITINFAACTTSVANCKPGLTTCWVESVLSFIRLIKWHMLHLSSGFLNSRHLHYFLEEILGGQKEKKIKQRNLALPIVVRYDDAIREFLEQLLDWILKVVICNYIWMTVCSNKLHFFPDSEGSCSY